MTTLDDLTPLAQAVSADAAVAKLKSPATFLIHVNAAAALFGDPKSHDPLMPMLICEQDDNRRAILSMPDMPNTSEERQQMMYALGRNILQETNLLPTIVVLVLEGWMASHANVEEAKAAPLPSKDANRREVFVVSYHNLLDNESLILVSPILRPEGESRRLDPIFLSLADAKDYMVAAFLAGMRETLLALLATEKSKGAASMPN